jgi:hypothetical protein
VKKEFELSLEALWEPLGSICSSRILSGFPLLLRVARDDICGAATV